jgi:hypothetical protein
MVDVNGFTVEKDWKLVFQLKNVQWNVNMSGTYRNQNLVAVVISRLGNYMKIVIVFL